MNTLMHTANDLFKSAGFDYAVCGGFGFDMFAGKELRTHGDFDIVVFKEDKRRVVQFMIDNGWIVCGRFMEEGRVITNYLFYKIDDIADSYWDNCKNMWAVKAGCLPQVLHKLDRLQGARGDVYTYQTRKWLVQDDIEFIELEIDSRDGDDFVVQESPRITRSMDKAMLSRDGVPYLAPEIILFYKSDRQSSEHPGIRPKTEADFKAIIPLLSEESKTWLTNALNIAYPDGYGWLSGLL